MIGAIDVGGTKIAIGVVTETGKVLERIEWPTSSLPSHAAVRCMAEKLLRFSRHAGVSLQGIGIGCTGPVDPLTGVIGDVGLLPGWSGFPLAEQLFRETGLSVAVENDADAAALAEAHWGTGKSATRFVYVTISTGIGAGFVFDGHLYRGVNGSHPEAGHHILDPQGPLCYCGARGCWESLASGPAMVLWVKAHDIDGDLPENLTARRICELAREGQALAVRAVERESACLGFGLANLVTMFCPDVIALGGGVMQSADLFLDRAREIVRTHCRLVPGDQVTIACAALGDDTALLGAARVWQARFGGHV